MAETATIPVQEAGAHAPVSETTEQQPTPGGDQRPEWLPEKFKTPEQMAQAYAELERRLGGQGNEEKAPETEEQTPSETDETKTEDKPEEKTEEVSYGKAVDSALEGVGLKPADLWQEYQDNQGLTDQTYTKLEEAGYPRSVVDAFIQSSQQTTQQTQADAAEVMSVAGGEDGYKSMVDWAKGNLSQEEIQSFNAMVTSGNTWQAKAAVQALHAQYTAAEGKEANLTMGGNAPKADVFQSAVEASRAMAEARASKDPAKIKAVEQKMLRSNVFSR